MGFWNDLKQSATELGNKVNDAVFTARTVFEEDCEEYTCYSLETLECVEIKAKVIGEGNLRVSDDFATLTKELTGELFLVKEEESEIFSIVSVTPDPIDVTLKSRVERYNTTLLTVAPKKLALVER